jgi:hypothetical protein
MADATVTTVVALIAVGGVILTATSQVVIFVMGRRSTVHNDHLRRAFEKHLDQYESVFASARTVQDALSNYRVLSDRIDDRSDPFLHQLLEIAAEAARRYCVAVSWNHNPGMAYLALDLEQECLHVRDLLIGWLSVRRVRSGDVASIRNRGRTEAIPLGRVRSLQLGDYEELRLEQRQLVIADSNDNHRLREIDSALRSVIKELKTVMAY